MKWRVLPVVIGALLVQPVPAVSVPVPLPEGVASATAGTSSGSPFAAVAEAVIPAVVNISVEKTVRVSRRSAPESGPFDEFFRRFFPDGPGLPLEQERRASGSGVIISPDGFIVTSNHVVAGADRVVVRLADGTELRGGQVRVVGLDAKTDLAVIKVEAGRELPAIVYGRAEDVRIGDWAIAVGNPFGLEGTVTVGVVSAKGRSGLPLPEGPSYQDFIQTDASINPGNSGGALVNIRGELIGINTAIRSPVGANVGIGFAAPVDMVMSVTGQLMTRGRVVRGFLGIRPQPVTEAIRAAMGLASTAGVLVSEVVKDQPAEKAGLAAGDVLVEVGGRPVRDLEHFRRMVAEYAPGTDVELKLVRAGKELKKRVRLVEFPEDEASAPAPAPEPEKWFGMSVRAATAAGTGTAAGVVVEAVQPGSAAADAGIQVGDVILELGGRPTPGPAEFEAAARRQSSEERAVLVRVQRGTGRLFVALEPRRE
jgi:serine protease Do